MLRSKTLCIAMTSLALVGLIGGSVFGHVEEENLDLTPPAVGAVADLSEYTFQDPPRGGLHRIDTYTHYPNSDSHWTETTYHRRSTLTHFITSELHTPDTELWMAGDETVEK